MSDAEKAVVEAAEAQTAKAEAETAEAAAAAAATAVAAANAGAALAHANAAKAEAAAAETVEENEEDVEWLRSQVEAQGAAISQVAERQNQLANQTASILAGVEKLTASISAASPGEGAEPQKVDPEKAHAKNPASSPETNEDLTEKSPAQKAKAAEPEKPKRRWI